mmetsp:Transcript_35793/g.113091  ORF Transcript_35793/g.113091 Transcript_35793/m.113091 type:complete len:101 (-) Transcript_35793:1011-1313(-)
MSGSVHFKFKSALNYDTVSFDGVFISVSELKKSIADKKHLPKGSEAELVVCDAQTNEGARRRAPATRLSPLPRPPTSQRFRHQSTDNDSRLVPSASRVLG